MKTDPKVDSLWDRLFVFLAFSPIRSVLRFCVCFLCSLQSLVNCLLYEVTHVFCDVFTDSVFRVF